MQTKGNIALRSGRQVGKSTVIAQKAGEYGCTNYNKTILVIASVERQARLLFERVYEYIWTNHRKLIKKGKDRPTKHKINLINGSTIHCLPTGLDGHGIRGYTVDLLIADEAAFIPDAVWSAVTPMLAVTKGDIILLSTPMGKDNYFYRCFDDPNFTTFHISSEDCPRKNQAFLDQERKRMTKLQYAQEYLGKFIDELRQFFPTDLIRQCCTLKRTGRKQDKSYYLGIDVARMGADDTTFEILDATDKSNIFQVENIVKNNTLTTETTRMTLHLEKAWTFRRIYIDDGGVGAGVFDQLLQETKTRRKVEGINNSRKSIDSEKGRRRILKEDLYDNLLKLMEMQQIRLLDDDEVMMSLKSVQFEYSEEGRVKIFGNDTHITEGLIRAAWCAKDKHLKLWVASKKQGITI